LKKLQQKLFFILLYSQYSMGLFGSSKNELKCKKCGTILPDSERLKKHQEKAHNKKKDKCRTCGAEFDYEEGLRKHKKNCK
jgi:methionyl-tRNA synthetase